MELVGEARLLDPDQLVDRRRAAVAVRRRRRRRAATRPRSAASCSRSVSWDASGRRRSTAASAWRAARMSQPPMPAALAGSMATTWPAPREEHLVEPVEIEVDALAARRVPPSASSARSSAAIRCS